MLCGQRYMCMALDSLRFLEISGISVDSRISGIFWSYVSRRRRFFRCRRKLPRELLQPLNSRQVAEVFGGLMKQLPAAFRCAQYQRVPNGGTGLEQHLPELRGHFVGREA